MPTCPSYKCVLSCLFYASKDLISFKLQRILFMVLRLPSMKRKVELELGQAVQKIEGSFVPKGVDVIRHLSLPHEGKSPDWIFNEMSNMDAEMSRPSYRNGKLSGAVYRTLTFRSFCSQNLIVLICDRRWRRPRETHSYCIRKVLCL